MKVTFYEIFYCSTVYVNSKKYLKRVEILQVVVLKLKKMVVINLHLYSIGKVKDLFNQKNRFIKYSYKCLKCNIERKKRKLHPY